MCGTVQSFVWDMILILYPSEEKYCGIGVVLAYSGIMEINWFLKLYLHLSIKKSNRTQINKKILTK